MILQNKLSIPTRTLFKTTVLEILQASAAKAVATSTPYKATSAKISVKLPLVIFVTIVVLKHHTQNE